MNYLYRGMNIDYDISGSGKSIILLHGWGTNKETFIPLKEELINSYEVHLIDLIGFGKSDEPFKPFNLNDYINFLNDYITKNNIVNPIILGHSFGGRIAIKYASKHQNIDKLILVDSAGIKKRLTLTKWVSVRKYKLLKKYYKLFKKEKKYQKLISSSGSYDFKIASPVMKATLSNIIKEDLKNVLKTIKCETLIIWGKDDQETPYKDALKIKKLIKNSGLVTLDNTGHFPYLENKRYFNNIIKEYLQVNK